jgi:hypothetical protein
MKTKLILILILILFLCLAFAACSLPQARTATAPQPTATESPIRPANTPVNTPTPTLAPLPTATWAPGCPPSNLVAKILPANFAAEELVGAAYFDLPAGIESHSGWLIDFTDTNDTTVFGLETFGYLGQDYILLERIVCNEPGGKAFYLVLDVMPIPALHPDEDFGIAVACTLYGVHEEKILAVAQVPDNLTSQPYNQLGYELGPVRLAWLANIETGRFEPLATDGIQCYEELMGP